MTFTSDDEIWTDVDEADMQSEFLFNLFCKQLLNKFGRNYFPSVDFPINVKVDEHISLEL